VEAGSSQDAEAPQVHGDRIGRFFDPCSISCFRAGFFKSRKQIRATFFKDFFWRKMSWATFWATFFPRNRPVALLSLVARLARARMYVIIGMLGQQLANTKKCCLFSQSERNDEKLIQIRVVPYFLAQ
jgi:hypothetical protein